MSNLFTEMIEMELFGMAAMVTTLIIVGYGLPHQAYTLYKQKSAKGVSLPYFLLTKVSVFTFGVHGYFEAHNPYVWVPQVPGIFIGTLIILQIIYYTYFYRPHAGALLQSEDGAAHT